MLPATKKLADYFMSGNPEPDLPQAEPAFHQEKFDPKYLQLQLKRRRQMEMVKRMLEDAGYDDLAKMATLRRREFDMEE